jgi:hypothetical protein
MVEIFLIWTLVAGEAKDVDAFRDPEQCLAAKAQFEENLARAAAVRPELKQITLVGCEPLKVLPPKGAERPKESM